MTTQSHESPGLERRAAWLELDVVWVSLAIAVIWLAVLFDGVFGPDMTFMNGAGTTTTTIPSAVGVALFAAIATSSIAKRCFGRGRTQ